MRSNPDDSNSIELGKLVILKLLAHGPRNQVTARSQTTLHLLLDVSLTNLTFEGYLNCDKDIGQLAVLCCVFEGSQQDEDLMGRSIGKHLQVVRCIFVVT